MKTIDFIFDIFVVKKQGIESIVENAIRVIKGELPHELLRFKFQMFSTHSIFPFSLQDFRKMFYEEMVYDSHDELIQRY